MGGRSLRDLGEFGVIARIERAAARAGVLVGPGLSLGPGDDAALLRCRPGEDLVASTDAAVEDVHFRFETQSARTAGRRALVAALSDLAAMGARPVGFLCALAAPPELPLSRLDGLVAGLLAEAGRHRCPLAGGNLARARETALTLTVLGAVARGRALLRRGARAGDRLLVTGQLGRSALERARAERGLAPLRFVPEPRLRAGAALARLAARRGSGRRNIGGCIDVSDGLAADARHLAEAAAAPGLGAALDARSLPRPRGFDAACARLGLEPEALLLGGGEDYELLFSVRPDGPSPALLARALGVPVTPVGELVRRRGRGGGRALAPDSGWRHY